MKQNTPLIAYADCFSGISGDMFLGALLDAGLPEQVLRDALAKLDLDGYRLSVSHLTRSGIRATKLDVEVEKEQPFREYSSIKELLAKSSLTEPVKERALNIFQALAEAEAYVHGCDPDKVHFHEVGAIDSIIDIVGAAVGLDYFAVSRFISSPLPMPSGWVQCQHGRLPLPAPAVCELTKEMPVYGVDLQTELVTPTGAAIIKATSSDFGPMPNMASRQVGYGAGTKELANQQPNLFRLFLGESIDASEHQEVIITETNLDDWSPEGFPYLSEKLFQNGALDVVMIPIQMKKGRPGFTIQVISSVAGAKQLQEIILTETTAIGLRYRREQRWTLPRQTGTVSTQWGEVQAKRIDTPAGPRLTPEYEDCSRVARKTGQPLSDVYQEVQTRPLDAFKPHRNESE